MELLIVVAVIALLVGLVTVSLRGMRGAALRTKSLSALRQTGMGYSMYSQDHNGRLLPGYIGAALMTDPWPFKNLRVSLPSGVSLMDDDMQSYVWRLAPYVDDSWQTFFEEASAGVMTEMTAEYQRMTNQAHTPGSISEHPSYGLNSIFLGGDSEHGGVGGDHPWQPSPPKRAATRLSQVINPTRVIVFAPAAKAAQAPADVYDNVATGFCEIRAPFLDLEGEMWQNQQWSIGKNGLVEQATTGAFGDPPGGGLPIARTAKDVLHGGMEAMPVVHLDGSTAVQTVVELSADMRRWNPFEISLRDVDN
jgi:hypothetical protein